MKKIYICLSLLAVIVLGTACNNEWEDEQYEQYVSFKAPIASGGDGVTTIYVRYKDNGKVTYQLPIIVSGSTVNGQDRDIRIAVDKDTLETLNIERFSLYRPELWYTEMEEDKYEFPETVHIPAGSCVEQLNIDFNLQGIDMLEKWVLPLTIVDDGASDYQSHPRKNYAKALLKVVPFNDYSGSYTASSMKVYTYINGKPDNNARTTNKRTGYVIDNNSVFFYAGLINEDIICHFLCCSFRCLFLFRKCCSQCFMSKSNHNFLLFHLYHPPMHLYIRRTPGKYLRVLFVLSDTYTAILP